MSTFWENPVTVRVPASSANLGPGFDSFGLALGLYDEVVVQVSSGGLLVEVTGESSGGVSRDETHLVVRSMRRGFDAMGVNPEGLLVSCTNAIPHARGLGSSSGAIVAGLWGARALVVDGDERLSDADLLTLATEIEGHPDNVAACLFGGFTIAWTDANGLPGVVSRSVLPELEPIAFVPAGGVKTELARGLLPAEVPFASASFNLARSALLVDALTHDPRHLLEATADALHQDARSTAMPESHALVARLRALGIPALISGAGPTVLAFAGASGFGADEVRAASDVDAEAGWRVLALPVDEGGAVVLAG